MFLSDFFVTLPGRYLVESMWHSLTAVIVVEGALRAWRFHQPVVQQRFRTLVILLPAIAFPAYQLLDPARGTMSSRLNGLLNTDGWLYLEPFPGLPGYTFLVLLVVLTIAIFFLQELVPIVRNLRASTARRYRRHATAEDEVMGDALQGLPGTKPRIVRLDLDEPLIFSTTGAGATIYISRGTQAALKHDELEAAIAHELAHIRRSQSSILVLLFILRMMMFFNPVTLVAFRKIVHAEEDICDDVAVSWTRNPEALAAALRRLFENWVAADEFHVDKLSDLRSALEDYSHKLHIAARIQRLRDGNSEREEGWQWVLAIAALVIIVLNYYVI
jgi:Zn-dependent protease with chaperone function